MSPRGVASRALDRRVEAFFATPAQVQAGMWLLGFTFSLVSWLFSGAVLVISAAILGALLDRTAGAEPRPASA